MTLSLSEQLSQRIQKLEYEINLYEDGVLKSVAQQRVEELKRILEEEK